jgi:hypothetical protein
LVAVFSVRFSGRVGAIDYIDYENNVNYEGGDDNDPNSDEEFLFHGLPRPFFKSSHF